MIEALSPTQVREYIHTHYTPDRIVVAGYSQRATSPYSYDMAVARYSMRNGSLDTAFNGTGTQLSFCAGLPQTS